MATNASKTKRPRNTNFTAQEIEVLLTEVKNRIELINAPDMQRSLNSEISKRSKQDAWKSIAEAVSAVPNGTKRTADDVKTKWHAIKRAVLKIRDAGKTTGGGGPVTKPWFYDVALDIIGERSDIYGVAVPGGGQSTLLLQLSTQPDVSNDSSSKGDILPTTNVQNTGDSEHGLEVLKFQDFVVTIAEDSAYACAKREMEDIEEISISQPSSSISKAYATPAATVTGLLQNTETSLIRQPAQACTSLKRTSTPKKLNSRTSKRLKDITVNKTSYDQLLEKEIKNVDKEIVLLEKKNEKGGRTIRTKKSAGNYVA